MWFQIQEITISVDTAVVAVEGIIVAAVEIAIQQLRRVVQDPPRIHDVLHLPIVVIALTVPTANPVAKNCTIKEIRKSLTIHVNLWSEDISPRYYLDELVCLYSFYTYL